MFGRVVIVAVAAVLAWAVFVRPTEGAGPQRVYVVQRGDTLWEVAARNYAGDVREAVWRVRERNRLSSSVIEPGRRLVLP